MRCRGTEGENLHTNVEMQSELNVKKIKSDTGNCERRSETGALIVTPE